MADTTFNKNLPAGSPADTTRTLTIEGPGTAVYSPGVTGGARNSLFQKDHVVADNTFNDPLFKTYFDRISSSAAGQYKFDVRDFALNGELMPSKAEDALRRETKGTLPFKSF
jgi:hypothetical protein